MAGVTDIPSIEPDELAAALAALTAPTAVAPPAAPEKVVATTATSGKAVSAAAPPATGEPIPTTATASWNSQAGNIKGEVGGSPSATPVDAPKQAESLIPDEALAAVLAEIDTLIAPPPAPAAEAAAAPSSEESGDAPAPAKKHRFVVGKKAPPPPAASDATSANNAAEKKTESKATDTAPDASGVVPKPSLGKRVFRLAEFNLELLHRPFNWVSNSARSMIGMVSLATIAVCGMWMGLRSVLLPNRDAISFVQEKRHALEHPPAKEAAEEKGGHGEAKPSGHGEAKSDKKGPPKSDAHAAAKSDGHGKNKDAQPKKADANGKAPPKSGGHR